jgi:hypothetical protein
MVEGDPDSAIRVLLTPAHSSFFAGEPFSATITFTNTRSPDAEPPPPQRCSHTCGAHSISSAPLARPPTSPRTPRTPIPTLPTFSRNAGENSMRKGLIGREHQTPVPVNGSSGDLPQLMEQRRKKLMAKSLSVSISPRELEEKLRDDFKPRIHHCGMSPQSRH